ncbi:hypothetical protein D6C85_01642 [Aureobasidium pullulans]|uniref:Uncharacterized protein n=1 Tax=Aureobasidium pullulans TaxID=5580 RepID=A0A4S9XI40_AURPU|nr:hypothetical protein D6D28_04618 [Aureobasidium pullulans]THZ77503.1 hypothetical protein D6C85_01642 [Aureobasidium pullulans]
MENITAQMEATTLQTEDSPESTISDLKSNNPLWWRIHVFTYDLRHYRERPDSLERLETIVDISYLSTPYFNESEVTRLKSTLLSTGKTLEETIEQTLHERLNRRLKKRQESNDYRVCAAHDLAPIFEKAFDLDHKQLARDVEFLKLVDENGLEGGEEWTGLATKSICGPKAQPGKKKRNNNNRKKTRQPN